MKNDNKAGTGNPQMRKIYYLKPNIQYAFTGAFTLVSAIEIALFTFLLYVFEHMNIHRSYDIMLYIRFSFIFFMVLLISGFNFWFGMRLSHRIVGPMIQIQRVLERVSQGKFESRIQLRKNDYLHELAENINNLIDDFENKQPKPTEENTQNDKNE
jgi:nitrogen fixation/metabolism regulation signal transduction histidine kinase